MAVVAGAWLLMAHVAGAPYMWAGLGFIDAVFEAMSGLTTTGATVIRDFGTFGRGMFFWRSMTQWLGGMGVIALFVAVLPRLAIGGRELFFAEASGLTQEKLTPHLRQTASALWKLYAALTAGSDAGAVARGHDAVRCGVPCDDDPGRRWILAASAIARRLSESRDPVDRHALHVPRGRELRAPGAGAPRQPAGARSSMKNSAPTPASSSSPRHCSS